MLPTFLSISFHSKMKYIAINFHFVCDHVVNENLIMPYISTKDQLANALTKPLSRQLFFVFNPRLVSRMGAPSCSGVIVYNLVPAILQLHILIFKPHKLNQNL